MKTKKENNSPSVLDEPIKTTDSHLYITIQGISPLLMDCIPEHLLFPNVSKPTFKGKTPLPREEAQMKLYQAEVDGETKIVVPMKNIFKCFIEGGRFHKVGRSQVTTRDSSLLPGAVTPVGMVVPLTYPKPWEVYSQMITNQATNGKVPCHRPRFDEWSLEIQLLLDPANMAPALVRAVIDDAGKKIGLGPGRPERKGSFGKFVVVSWVCE